MSIWHKTAHYNDVCTHVLIIGTSKYAYLPDDPSQVNKNLLDLTSISTPAISAYRFACWIKNNYNNSKAPLGSIRLLLSPSQEEIDNEPALDDFNQYPPNVSNVKDALHEWQQDCFKFRESHCILYISGHGIRLSADSGIVLLEDFGNPNRSILEGAIDIGNIHQAMAQNHAAKNQFYFVDACSIEPEIFSEYLFTPIGVTLPIKRGEAVESSPIFFGAAPGTLALGKPGEGTLFIQALLQCLETDAVEADDINNPSNWQVYTLGLSRQLENVVNRLAHSYGERQSVRLGGISADVIFHELKIAPLVPLTVSLSPEKSTQYAEYKLTNITTNILEDEQFPFVSPKINTVNPGIYSIGFYMTEESGYQNTKIAAVIVNPPRCSVEVSL